MDTHDAKYENLRQVGEKKFELCPHCKRFHRHHYSCPHASPEDLRREAERAVKHERWAREKAARLLRQLQLCHGKLSQVKGELRKLRDRQNKTKENQQTKK